jgi:hypothetical protein
MSKTRKAAEPKRKGSVNGHSYPTQEEIKLRAYHIYLERGGAPGDELGDWTAAERELVEKYSKGNHKDSLKTQAA